jgi:hypothetical protein
MTERRLCARLDSEQRRACVIDYAKRLRTPFPDSFRVRAHPGVDRFGQHYRVFHYVFALVLAGINSHCAEMMLAPRIKST